MCVATSRALDPLGMAPTPSNITRQMDPLKLHKAGGNWTDPGGLIEKSQRSINKTAPSARVDSSGLQIRRG